MLSIRNSEMFDLPHQNLVPVEKLVDAKVQAVNGGWVILR